MRRIGVTHAGDAHLDDFLCAAVLFAQAQVDVVLRREPSREELDDPRVVVFDVGGRHEPARSNFDHHQLPRDAEPACALSLLVEGMSWRGESVLEAFTDQKWFRTLKVIDSKGPFALAKELGTTPEVVFQLLSPVQEVLVDGFGQQTEAQGDEVLGQLLASLGVSLLDSAIGQLQRVKALCNECLMVEAGGVPGYVLRSEDVTGTETWRERFAPGTAFSIVYDNRGPGWTLYRYDDDSRLDFSRLAGRDDVSFAHPGGFIVKTASREKVGLEQALQLVQRAVVGPR